jgi:ATP-dependent helicase HrpB
VKNDIARRIAETGLPLVPWLRGICQALDDRGAAVLRSDPGSGKSTLVPLALLDYFRPGESSGVEKIIMLEPRRAAVFGIASRLAELLGEETGAQAGYAVRLERKISARTRIEVITEGLLTRRLQENPDYCTKCHTIIFDEFHERSIHTDLALAFVMDLRRMGAQTRLLIMSATMDAASTAAFIDHIENRSAGHKTPVIECPGRNFPVEKTFLSLPHKAPPEREWAAALCGILRNEAADSSLGDILVFLPGRREIEICAETVRENALDRTFEINILHGSLPLAEQKKIIMPRAGHAAARRRVILSTNVAETGLTIPGVTLVVDSGFVRVQRFHIPSGMNRLSLEPSGGNSAEQRAGRAGRLGPGRCIRLWAEQDCRPRETAHEITRIDISAAVLECLLWGAKDPDALPWLESPPHAAWERALEMLRLFGAIDENRLVTETGRQMTRPGLEPRLARLCIAGLAAGGGMGPLACTAAAALSGRDGSGIPPDDADFCHRLSVIRNGNGGIWAQRVLQNAADILVRLGASAALAWSAADEAAIGATLAAAFPDRIIKRQGGVRQNAEGIFRFAQGREVRVRNPLAAAEWLCALEVDAGERTGFVHLAVAVPEDAALTALKRQAVTVQSVEWKGLIPRLHLTVAAGRMILSEEQRPCRRDEIIPALSLLLKERGIAALPWEEDHQAARRFLERIRFWNCRKHTPPGDWTDRTLIDGAADWLGPFVWNGAESGKAPVIDSAALVHALEYRLGQEAQREIERVVPACFQLPSGRNRPIDYSSGEPVVRLRLQDAFGIAGRQAILSAPVVFQLLSPADRPIQITRDLDGFWAGSYADVRREMRGRYPKHNWPENPGTFMDTSN